MSKQAYFDELIELLKTTSLTKKQISFQKMQLCKKYGVRKIPKDLEVLMHAKREDLDKIRRHLLTKPVRTMSGVTPVAIMTEPRWCPHGRCTYCPGGIKSAFGDVPQSYTGNEPSTMRAIRNKFNAYYQTFNRLEYYVIGGHIPDKVDLIVQGGTFPSYEKEYQVDFIAKSLQAMNDFGDLFFPDGEFAMDKFKEFFELPADLEDVQRAERIKERMEKLWQSKGVNMSLSEIQTYNESAQIRCIGMTLETRPDRRLPDQVDLMLELGATRIELGVQSIYDDVLKAVHRDHTIAETRDAFVRLKDVGFKINAHMMPGLPGVDEQKDIASLHALFEDPVFRPDMMKVYPTMVMKGTPLYKQYERGEYTPITTLQATKIIGESMRYVPRYCRVMRVQRDIPTHVTEAGVDRTNLRQYVDEYMQEHKIVCQDIRYREIKFDELGNPSLHVESYDASEGQEYFISFDNEQDKLIGYCRLRFPGLSIRPEIDGETALIRELHVNGSSVAIGARDERKTQHRGFGKKLLAEAERIAREAGKKKMVIISGIGVRAYYRKFGYELEGPYMVKEL